MKQKLFNPFIQLAGFKAFMIGLGIVVASTFFSWIFNTHFDGVLDIHYLDAKNLGEHFMYSVINLFSLITIFYLLALILTGGKTRLIDIAGTMTFARFPFLLAPFLNIGDINSRIGEKIIYGMQAELGEEVVASMNFKCNPCTISTFEYIYLIFGIVVLMLIIIWFVALLFSAYRISTNLKGSQLIISFITGLILAEVASSILIRLVL